MSRPHTPPPARLKLVVATLLALPWASAAAAVTLTSVVDTEATVRHYTPDDPNSPQGVRSFDPTPVVSETGFPAVGGIGPVISRGLRLETTGVAEAQGRQLRASAGAEVSGPEDTDPVNESYVGASVYVEAYATFSDQLSWSESVNYAQIEYAVSGNLTTNAFADADFDDRTPLEPIEPEEGFFRVDPPADPTLEPDPITIRSEIIASLSVSVAGGDADVRSQDRRWKRDGNGTSFPPSSTLIFESPVALIGGESLLFVRLTTIAEILIPGDVDTPGAISEPDFLLSAGANYLSTMELLGMRLFDADGNELPLAGNVTSASGFDYSYAVPEPATALLVALGLVGLNVAARARRRRA